MNQKQVWHQPKIQLLDVRATAQPDNAPGTGDDMLFDPNGRGDLGPDTGSETHTAGGASHARADAS